MRALVLLAPLAAAIFVSACSQQGGDSASSAAQTIEERGRVRFSACAVCHSTKNPAEAGYAATVGPSLFAIHGARSAHDAGFDYSKAMREANLVWDDATLDAFIENPQKIVPRSRMAYAGMPNAEDRAAIVAYLKTLQ